ncbi:GNAT family N-acetyltransferase [Clostridium sp. 'deep sea']|uniref:GNAT family N-acetyltransferase n=1 Tax=Clostridium sp. 'deep sea' TaxID=2779445 RepID=UPI001896716B|nr:GNAT family N-acetyltransferase [Clostridium sp. 'deep sea']QOR34883.1 GNAT family N-acetyltransferase [Clostridium sp. 'deep sea']
MKLLSKRLGLKSLQLQDIEFLQKLEQNPLVQKYEQDIIPTANKIKIKYTNYLNSAEYFNNRKYYFIVKKNDINIGKVTLKTSREAILEWEMGWAFDPEYWGNGYASEAALRLLHFAVKHRNARRIIAKCHEGNKGSEKVMLKIGMQKEGLFRKTLYLNHTWYNQIIYSILKEEVKDI